MRAFVLERMLQSFFALWGVITIVFFILQLSGDPTVLLVPEGATREDIAELRHQLGFDRPMLVQYGDYLWKLAQLDFGKSIVQNIPVSEIVASRIPFTLWLSAAALVVALGIGMPLGLLISVYRGRWIERPLMGLVLIGQSMPTFWSGILLIMLFAVTLNLLPSSGAEGLSSLLMPAICLGALSMATFARVTRNSVLEELASDYVRVAHAKGLKFRTVLLRHVVRNAAVPLITIAALEIANLLAGAVIVETVFAWPGLGLLAVQSIEARDFLIVQTLVLMGATAYILLNFIADLLYGVVDPRISLVAGT